MVPSTLKRGKELRCSSGSKFPCESPGALYSSVPSEGPFQQRELEIALMLSGLREPRGLPQRTAGGVSLRARGMAPTWGLGAPGGIVAHPGYPIPRKGELRPPKWAQCLRGKAFHSCGTVPFAVIGAFWRRNFSVFHQIPGDSLPGCPGK